MAVRAALLLAFVLLACGDDTAPVEPLFPANYADTYTEVRDCRQSGDHDLNIVRILADPAALAAYSDRMDAFPPGAIVLKEEYEFGDVDCEGPIRQWTAMEKLEVGADATNLDWFWQRVDADRRVATQNDPRCASCHRGCGVPPDGYDGTCTVP
jgi:hypothetical protein